jgi:hypothetical protein
MYNYFKFSGEMLLRYKEHALRLIEMSEDSVGVFEIDSMTCVFSFARCGDVWIAADEGADRYFMIPSVLSLYADTLNYLSRSYQHV